VIIVLFIFFSVLRFTRVPFLICGCPLQGLRLCRVAALIVTRATWSLFAKGAANLAVRMSRGDMRLSRTMTASMRPSDLVRDPKAFSAKVPLPQSERIASSRPAGNERAR
jgi:hypothetical protein